MKKELFLSALILASATLFAESNSAVTYKQIPQNIAKEIMDTHDDIIILDVRTKKEFDSGHIKGAICIPVETIDKALKELPNKNQTILIYCRSGRRSRLGAQKLVELGYTDVREFGGIIDWSYGTVK